MNRYFIIICLTLYLCGCSNNSFKLYKLYNKNTIVDIGESKDLIEKKLGNAIKYEKNNDGTIISVYSFTGKNYIILYNKDLKVTHFIID